MWTRTYSKTFQNVKREVLWDIWMNVNEWKNWFDELEYCKIHGSFVIGNHFSLKQKGIPPIKVVIIDIQEGYSFTSCTSFFQSKMYYTHSIENTSEGLKLNNTVRITGSLYWLLVKIIGKKVIDVLPAFTEALAKIAQENNIESI